MISRNSLLALIKVLKAFRLEQKADALFTAPGSNRGYYSGNILMTLILMIGGGARSLSDVRHLYTKRASLKRAGLKKIPGVNTLTRWLLRHGKAGVPLIDKLNQTVIAKALESSQVKCVTLDINSTAIFTEKASAKWIDRQHRGFTMMVGTLAGIDQVVATRLHPGNVSSNSDNLDFIKTCQELLPIGTILERVHIDSTGYQHQVIEYLIHHKIEFVIRATMNSSIAQVIAALSDSDWQPLRLSDGSLLPHKWVARCTHTMHRSNLISDLVVQCSLKKKAIESPHQQNLLGPSTYDLDRYEYCVIATNIKGLDDSQIVHECNQRSEHSEKRIKELKSDFAASRLPCSDFEANALYVCVCALAYNVFAPKRADLPAKSLR